MSDETGLEKITAKEKERELKEAEDRLERIKQILGSVQSGWSVALYRRSPGWAEGHLETKRIVGEGEELDLDYIAQQWGGEVIQVRIQDEHGKYVHSTEIPFRSYPPKVWGKEIPHPNYRHLEYEKNGQSQTTQRDPLSSIDTIVGIIERLKIREEPRQRDNNLDLGIIELLLRHQATNQQATSPFGAVEQFIHAVESIKSLRGVFGDETRPPADDDMISKITGVLDTVLKIRQTSPPPAPKIAAPRPQIPVPQIGPVQQPQIQRPVNNPVNNTSIADQLAALDPETAAENVLLALDKMDEKQREKALQVFFTHLGVEEDTEPFDETVEKLQSRGNGTSTDRHD